MVTYYSRLRVVINGVDTSKGGIGSYLPRLIPLEIGLIVYVPFFFFWVDFPTHVQLLPLGYQVVVQLGLKY